MGRSEQGFYGIAGRMYAEVVQGKGTVQNIVLSSNARHKKGLLALLSETLKYRFLIREIIAKAGLDDPATAASKPKLKKNHNRKPDSPSKEALGLEVLVYEYLWSPELNGASSRCKKARDDFLAQYPIISQNKTRLQSEWTKIKVQKEIRNKEELLPDHVKELDAMPKYARINRIVPNAESIVFETLSKELYLEATLVQGALAENYCKTERGVVLIHRDTHIPELLVFPSGTKLYDHRLVKEGLLILQDKASCMAAFALNPPPGSFVLDATAAPGNKTTHLAAIIGPSGHVIAIEKDPKRFCLLEKMCRKARLEPSLLPLKESTSNGKIGHDGLSSRVTLIHGDFLSINPSEAPFNLVEYILLDPSCSGSGMLSRLDTFTEEERFRDDVATQERLANLSNFQTMALIHALSFPCVKSVLYSTCSIHAEENEHVVSRALENTLKNSIGEWRLEQRCMPDWTRRGLVLPDRMSREQAICLIRADPVLDRCNGFFIAKFIKK